MTPFPPRIRTPGSRHMFQSSAAFGSINQSQTFSCGSAMTATGAREERQRLRSDADRHLHGIPPATRRLPLKAIPDRRQPQAGRRIPTFDHGAAFSAH